MTEAPERTTVTSLTDLVEVVPSLLGFHPHESLVLLAIRDGMVQLTARTDLFDAPPARALAPAWHRLPGAHFVVIAFSADAGCAWWGLDDVDLASQLRRAGLERAARRSWSESAEQTLTAYRTALDA